MTRQRTIVSFVAAIALAVAGGRAGAVDTVLTNLNVPNGTTYTVGSGDSLSVGSGSSNFIGVADGGGWTGTLDVSAATSFTANVGEFRIASSSGGGSPSSPSNGVVRFGVNNTITVTGTFALGSSGWDWTTGTATTANGGITTIHTPLFRLGWAVANGTSSGIGRFTLGTGATLLVDGISGGRTEMFVGYDEEQYGRSSSGTMDLSGGVADLKLTSLTVGGQLGNANTPGTLTMSSNVSNRLDVSGAGSVVKVGYFGKWYTNDGGSGTGTLDIGNLGSNSAITSTDNGTAILVGYKEPGSGGSATGTVKLGGGTLTITTTGAAIAGGGGTSNLSLDGTVLVAGASSSAWFTGLSSAKVRSGGVTFNTNGNDIGMPQALLADDTSTGGGLTKAGGGTLTLSGSNTFTGPTSVTGGRLVVSSSSRISSSSVTIGSGAELYFRSSTALGTAPVFTGTGATLNASGTMAGGLNVTANNSLTVGTTPLTVTGLTLGDNTTVSVESGGASRVQINGNYTDSLGPHTLLTGFAAAGTPYPFFSWTGNSGSLTNGLQSNWGVQEGDTGTKNWTQASSGSWNSPSAWDAFVGSVVADTSAKTLSYVLTYVSSGTKAPTIGNDVVIDPAASGVTVTGPVPAATVRSLQVGGTNASSPTLALGAANLTTSVSVTVAGNGTLDATSGGLITPTLTVNGAGAVATLANAAGSVTTANVSAGSLTMSAGVVTTANVSGGLFTADGGTVATANLTGSGTLAGTLTVPQVNVTAGTPTMSGRATTMTVSGGRVTASGATIGTLNMPAVGAGTFVVGGGGATVGKADFTTSSGTVNAAIPLAVSGTFQQGTLVVTAGATPFKAGGSNLVNKLDTLVLQGSTTRIEQLTAGYVAGLNVRAWRDVNAIDGPTFNITVADPAGSSNNSTYNGTIGYATQSIDMNGNDQEHFGTNSGSGVPNDAPRPTGYVNNYTVEYRGLLSIPSDGTYRFATTSDDGSALWIDVGDIATANPTYATANVQNNYYQGMTIRWGSPISLASGYHSLIVRMYEGGGGNGLKVQWDPTGGTTAAAIPGTNYYHGGLAPGLINLPDLNVSVTADSELDLDYSGAATLGNISVTAGAVVLRTATAVSIDAISSPGTGSISADGPISLRSGTVNVSAGQTLALSGRIADGTLPTTLIKTGSGTLALGYAGQIASGNVYTGGTRVNEGTLQLVSRLALPENAAVTLGAVGTSGIFDLNGFETTLGVGSITFNGTGSQVLPNGLLVLQAASGDSTVTVNAGSHAIDADTSLGTNTVITTATGSVLSLGGAIGGDGTLTKAGGGRVAMEGSNGYTGATVVQAGMLAVNGAITASPTVTVQAGAVLGGSGRISRDVRGAGTVAPGNSPGILTIDGQIVPTDLTSFAYEFTATGAPTWSSGTASVNDVLRLTNASPFDPAALAAGNVVDIYFDVANLAEGDTFRGGFFSDQPAESLDFAAAVLSATYRYFVRAAGGPVTYNGVQYRQIGSDGVVASVVTVDEALFSGGTVYGGQVTQFEVFAVPEPASLALAAAGLAALGLAGCCRRSR